MILGIVTALPGELSALTRERIPAGTCRPLRDDLLVQLSGVGPHRASRAGAELLEGGATALLSWGTAAALSRSLGPGSLILPECVIGADRTRYAVDAGWRQRLNESLSPKMEVHGGALAESRDILSDPEGKRRLGQEVQAVAADMESAALAQLAEARGIPFCAIRVIVDPAGMSLPSCISQAIGTDGQPQFPALIRHALTHPLDLIRMVQLGRHFHTARQTLKLAAQLTGLSA